MTPTITAPFNMQLLALRTGLLEQLAQLQGSTGGCVEAGADDVARPMDSEVDLAIDRAEPAILAG